MKNDPQCIFCRIAGGGIPAELIYEDDLVVGFRDLHPVAPFHALLIPREHIATLDDLGAGHEVLAGRLVLAAGDVARRNGLDRGYRLVANCREAAGQEVFHLHLHLLGGRGFHWPPG